MAFFLPDGVDANWSKLGDGADAEFESLAAVFKWCNTGRELARESGLIVLQSAAELQSALLTIPTMDQKPNEKARKATRLLRYNALLLATAQMNFARTPKKIMEVYEQELSARRNRKPIRIN